jgi:hypothetical protein
MQRLGPLRHGHVLDAAVCRLQVYRMLGVRPVQSDIRHDLHTASFVRGCAARVAWVGASPIVESCMGGTHADGI